MNFFGLSLISGFTLISWSTWAGSQNPNELMKDLIQPGLHVSLEGEAPPDQCNMRITSNGTVVGGRLALFYQLDSSEKIVAAPLVAYLGYKSYKFLLQKIGPALDLLILKDGYQEVVNGQDSLYKDFGVENSEISSFAVSCKPNPATL